MVFLVGGANSAADTGISNSLRFNNDAELAFTPGSEGNREHLLFQYGLNEEV